MPRTRLLYQLLLAFALVTLLPLALATALATREVRRVYLDQAAAVLEVRARQLQTELTAAWPVGSTPSPAALQQLCDSAAQRAGMRLTLIDAAGAVLADTATEPTHLANHNDRPEVRAARLRGSGHAWRRSDSTGH
ncbi:MAG: hypothetical protein IT204_25930, partial [Fimbriimonadaceae bacterium]|nr:hypothetical protein [Fimbriimonadaceae bacterium]